jgi:hypothetical protein
MNRFTRRIARYFGYEVRRISPLREETFDENSQSWSLRDYFDKTEGMISFEEATLLYNLARELAHGCIVELGSYRGRSTVALGRGSLDGHAVPVYAIEPHEKFRGVLGGEFGVADRGAFYQAMLDTGCYRIVRLINLSSQYVTPNWDKNVALLWIDGDHTYTAVKRDVQCWLPHLTSDAKVVFDDSTNPELGPKQVVEELLASRHFTEIQRVGKVRALQRGEAEGLR